MLRKLINTISAFNRGLVLFEKSLLIFLLSSMLILSIWRIVERNFPVFFKNIDRLLEISFFSGGFSWIDLFLKICVLWIAFTGASLAYEQGRHIKIDVLTNIIKSEKSKAYITATAQILSMIICFILFAASVKYIQMISTSDKASIISFIPDWYFRLIIPYSFLTMVLRTPINIYLVFSEKTGLSEPGGAAAN